MYRQKIASRAGMLGPALFTLSFTLGGLLRPGYSPVRMYISELSIGPGGWIQMLSFVCLGVCVLLFALGLKAFLPAGKAARAATALFITVGVCYILSGPFVTDPAAMFDNQQTLHGTLHGIFGAIVFSLSAASCFVLWRSFTHTDWRCLAAFSLIAGIVMVVLIALMKVGQLQTGIFHDWAGVVQRCCLITSYALIFTIALRMRGARRA
ncbi:MAG: DUF998 domain-containing protein [Firmicutes bacterium]|nr:DUF998 domain-containing protein [Bacillota bacterium]